MNCAMSLSSQLRFWGMMSCKDPTRRMSLFMSTCYNYFCMGWFLVRTLVWSWTSRTSGKYEVYEGMYWFIGISRVSGLLDSLKMSTVDKVRCYSG